MVAFEFKFSWLVGKFVLKASFKFKSQICDCDSMLFINSLDCLLWQLKLLFLAFIMKIWIPHDLDYLCTIRLFSWLLFLSTYTNFFLFLLGDIFFYELPFNVLDKAMHSSFHVCSV